MTTLITSAQNPRVKHLVALRDRRQRERDHQMVVEGFDELSLALDAEQPLELYYCLTMIHNQSQMRLIDQAQATGAEAIEVNERVFERIAYRDDPDGWLAVFPLRRRALENLTLSESPLIIVTEAIEKPGNLGAILRTSDAAGVTAVIVCDSVTDLGNPNVVRSSKGAVFCVPVAEATTQETLVWLSRHGIKRLATTPQATENYSDVDMSGPVAIAVGAEKPGLSQKWLDQADLRVQIPMVGRVNSLNVATSAALLIYEAVNQRRRKGLKSLRT